MTNPIKKVYKNGVEYDIYATVGKGDVVGPSSSTNGHLAVFDGNNGKKIKDGGAIPVVPTNVSAFNNDAGYLVSVNEVPSGGTAGQVVTKKSEGYGWEDNQVNTKTFYLSGRSDLTTAQAAYDWYKDGKDPIIFYDSKCYVFDRDNNTDAIYFVNANTGVQHYGSHSNSSQRFIQFSISSNSVTTITIKDWNNLGFLTTNVNYSYPYTPQYDGSPATKKYVDDNDTVISGDSGVKYTIKVSNTAPASGTASNTITIVTD